MLGLAQYATGDRKQATVRSAQRAALCVLGHGTAKDLLDLPHSPSDAASDVSKSRWSGHPRGPHALDLSAHDLGHVLAQPRITRVADGSLHHGRVHAHLAPSRYVSFDREGHDTIEQGAKRLAIEKL